MLGNLLRPFLLARLSLALAATVACIVGVWAALAWIRAEKQPIGSPERIEAERRGELTAALVQTALAASALGLFVTMVGAEGAHHEIRGAMCAYGVLGTTAHGFQSLLTSVVATLACAGWLALHRLDLRLPTPELSRTKLLALFAVLPATGFDLITATRFALELDFSVVATCCSTGVDTAGGPIAFAASRAHVFPLALGLGALALGASVRLAKRPGRVSALAASTSMLAFAGAGLLATIDVVSPHAYGRPGHRCAFCLLSEVTHGIGYPMLGALLVSACLGAALLALESERERAADDADDVERGLARYAVLTNTAALVLLVLPVALYRLETGAFVVSPW